jgi:integrase
MALIRQKGRNIWQARIWIPELKQRRSVSTGTADRDAARRIEAELMSVVKGRSTRERLLQLLDDVVGRPEARISLVEAMGVYEGMPEAKVSRVEGNLRRYNWQRFCEWLGREYPEVTFVDQVTRGMAFGFAAGLEKDTTIRSKTGNHIKNRVARVFRVLELRAGLRENPFDGVKNFSTGDSETGRAFTDGEVAAILGACAGTEMEGAVLVGLYTGLRWSDVVRLRWDELREVQVGAGGAARVIWMIELTPRKTAKHRTVVRIPLHGRVLEWLQGRRAEAKGALVFPWLESRQDRRKKSDFTLVLMEAGIEARGAKLSFHCLRHTFATRLSAAETEAEVIRRLGGWKNESIAQIYQHDVTKLARAIDLLPG